MSNGSTVPKKFSSLLRRCRHLKSGQKTHTQILTHGLHVDPTLQTDLILMYSRTSHLVIARLLFDQMPCKTMHSWNILISSYVQSSLYMKSLYLLYDLLHANFMPDHFTLPCLFKACGALNCVWYGRSLHSWVVKVGLDGHVVVMTSVLDMYVKFVCMDDACKVFDAVRVKDASVWNSMISGFAKAGLLFETMELCRRLQFEGGEMDAMAIPSLLSVCGKGGELRKGKEVHGRMMRCLVSTYDVAVNNSLVEMYGKCGCIHDSHKVFFMMGDIRNLISWSTMISCYGVHGRGKEALSLYDEMIEQGFRPNSITFTSILSSCNHSGLVNEGRELFNSMIRDYGLEPSVEHYACMVDLLGRAGFIAEAMRLMQGMQIEAKASIWGALLSVCVFNSNTKVAEIAAHKLFELEPENCSNYITLCSVYEMNGMFDNVAKMRAKMKELGMVKAPGCSWINMNGRTRVFYQGKITSSELKELCDVLDGLMCSIITARSLSLSDNELKWVEG